MTTTLLNTIAACFWTAVIVVEVRKFLKKRRAKAVSVAMQALYGGPPIPGCTQEGVLQSLMAKGVNIAAAQSRLEKVKLASLEMRPGQAVRLVGVDGEGEWLAQDGWIEPAKHVSLSIICSGPAVANAIPLLASWLEREAELSLWGGVIVDVGEGPNDALLIMDEHGTSVLLPSNRRDR